MTSLSRRSVTTGLAAAVTAIPAVGLSRDHMAHIVEDPLLPLLRRFQESEKGLREACPTRNATRGLTQITSCWPPSSACPRSRQPAHLLLSKS
jgi:hypothetical protein